MLSTIYNVWFLVKINVLINVMDTTIQFIVCAFVVSRKIKCWYKI